MSKFVSSNRNLVKSIVAILSLKRIPDKEIINEIKRLSAEERKQIVKQFNEDRRKRKINLLWL